MQRLALAEGALSGQVAQVVEADLQREAGLLEE
jgi:hypothetical protein